MTSSINEFIPLSVPNLKGRELELVTEAVRSEWVSTGGPFITQFEKQLASYTGAKHAVACQSGTAGLHVALLLAGVQADDEVITPALTFVAPVNTIRYVGAYPVFMDSDDFLCIDVNKTADFLRTRCQRDRDGTLRNLSTGRRIACVLPVHVFGNTADMVSLMALCDDFALPVVEDASESLGTYWTNGPYASRHSGTIGRFGVYSFNGNKIITTGGGGMLVTDDEELAQRARYLTTQAKDDEVSFIHHNVGFNYRMTNLQAALGIAQLEQLEQFVQIKAKSFSRYERQLASLGTFGHLLPFRDGIRSNQWFFSFVLESPDVNARQSVIANLLERGIQTRPLWFLNHKQRPFASCESYHVERAENYWRRVVNLPCSTNITHQQIDRVAQVLAEVLIR